MAQTRGKFASETDVPVSKTKAEIESTLERYGADGWISGQSSERAMFGFSIDGRQFRLFVPLPEKSEAVWKANSSYHRRGEFDEKLYDKLVRQRWRALLLIIKANLEAVELNMISVEQAFLAWEMLPDGRTVSDWLIPEMITVYASGNMPPLLPSGG